MILEPHIECASRDRLVAIQASRLRAYLRNIAARVPQYWELMVRAGLDQNLDSGSDEDLLARFNSAGFTDASTYVSIDGHALNHIDRRLFFLETTSGTTGAPKARYATVEDDLIDKRLTMRSFAAFDIAPHDRVVTVDVGELSMYGLMTKALAELGVYESLFYSARKPFGESMKEALASKPDVLITIPGILMRSFTGLVESIKAAPCVKKLVYYAEPLEPELQQYLLRELGIQSFSLYSSIEFGMIGAECTAHDGVHLWADCLLPALKDAAVVEEVIFRSQDRQVFHGSLGMTGLMQSGKPTFAYLIGDQVDYTEAVCACGRTLPRIRFAQRESDIFSIYGAKYTYKQIHDVVYKNAEITNLLQIVLENGDQGAIMTLLLPKEGLYALKKREQEIYHNLRTHSGLSYMVDHGVLDFELEFLPAQYFTKRKIRRVDDRRGKLEGILAEEKSG
jgi:phenylacetate-CoA ligase